MFAPHSPPQLLHKKKVMTPSIWRFCHFHQYRSPLQVHPNFYPSIPFCRARIALSIHGYMAPPPQILTLFSLIEFFHNIWPYISMTPSLSLPIRISLESPARDLQNPLFFTLFWLLYDPISYSPIYFFFTIDPFFWGWSTHLMGGSLLLNVVPYPL